MAQPVETIGLLEREDELEAIDAALRGARGGEGALVFVEGPAGIGKTELLSAARRSAAQAGMAVAGARGSELERELAFGIVRQLLGPFVASADRQSRAQLFSGAAALAERLFEPEPGSDDGAPGSEDRTFAVLHGLHWLFANLAHAEPLLLAVDDAHWADLASLRFLAYLAQRREGLPLALVVTSRPAETPVEEELLVRLATDPEGVAISPAALSRQAVATLLRSGLGRDPEPAFVEACRSATGGTPFLLRELIREASAQGVQPVAAAAARVADLGPRTIARAVVARVRRLSPAALGLARAAAVLGAEADPRRAARLAGVDVAAASAALDALAAAGVVTPGRPIEFVHPVLRSSIYAEIPAGERSDLHARSAALLRRDGIAEERIAGHLLATDPSGDQQRVELLLRTARTASARGAPGSAASYLERALAEPPTGELLVDVLQELGAAEVARGRRDAFAPYFQRAIDACSDPVRRARIGLELGRATAYAGDLPGAVAALDEALAGLDEPDSPLAMALEAELFTVAVNHYPSTERIAPRILARLAQLERGELHHPALLAVLALVLVGVRPPARIGADVAARVTREERLELTTWVHGYANALLFAGRLRDAADYYDRVAAELRSQGRRSTLAAQGVVRAGVALQRGLLGRAETEARSAFESIQDVAAVGGPAMLVWAAAYLVEALVARGALDEAERVLDRVGPVEELPPTYSRAIAIAARGRLRLAQGRAAEALADALASRPDADAVAGVAAGLEESLASASLTGVNPAVRPWGSDAAWAFRALERADEGRRLAEEELGVARAFDVPHAIGTALRALAACSEADDAIGALREAVEVLESSEARLELAHALVDLGSALRRARRRKDCQEPLRRGLDLAHRCGAVPLAERARDELLRTGARPRRVLLSGVESLTPGERRVAELAAEGMTNREIAQALFVTARTVEGHLTHVYRKLEIASREELADALAAFEGFRA